MKITVLGAGLVGYPMALDLKENGSDVLLCDINTDRLQKADKSGINTSKTDITDTTGLRKCTEDADIVINAVPGFMGYDTLKQLIGLGKNVVDIAFFPEDALQLDSLAKEKGVTVVFDAGVAPGMSNILTGYSQKELDRCDHVKIIVGGLPEERKWPWEYKAGFSPIDVIEEYTRPARLVRNGKEIVMPALSEAEFIDIEGLGTLEAFNSDGLRSLIRTIDCPDMSEKTLRYPGHLEKIAVLKASGFFSTDPIEIGGNKIRPVDLTAKLLFPIWEMGPADRDITVMKVEVTGVSEGRPRRLTWDLYDVYDEDNGIHSMARTTGYTATAISQLILQKKFTRKGVCPPEMLAGEEGIVEEILGYLNERGVSYKHESIFL